MHFSKLCAVGSQPHSSLPVPSSVSQGAGNLWTTCLRLPWFCQCFALTKRLEDSRKGEAISLSVPGGASTSGSNSNGKKWLEMSISVVSVPMSSNSTGKKASEQILWSHSPFPVDLLPALPTGQNQLEVRGHGSPVGQSLPFSLLSTKKGGDLIWRGQWMILNIAPLSCLLL